MPRVLVCVWTNSSSHRIDPRGQGQWFYLVNCIVLCYLCIVELWAVGLSKHEYFTEPYHSLLFTKDRKKGVLKESAC